MDRRERMQATKKITLVGVLTNIFLGTIKVVFGILGHSQALLADGIHSFSDLLSDFLVYFAAHYGGQDADAEHPYGHERIETAATMLLAILVILAGVGIMAGSIEHLTHDQFILPHQYVLLIAFISVLVKEGLYRYTLLIGNQIQSNLVRANAWHHRSDAASSVVVLIGVSLSLLGYTYFDAIAAIVVGLLIIKMGGQLGWESVRELIDTAVPEKTLHDIQHLIKGVPGVLAVHQLRTRSMGEKILVDVHVQVVARISVSEGHHIGQSVHQALIKNIVGINDVTVHIDPEDDEVHMPSFHLLDRTKVLPTIETKWQSFVWHQAIQRVVLHYLNGELVVDVFLPLSIAEDLQHAQRIASECKEALADVDAVSDCQVFFS